MFNEKRHPKRSLKGAQNRAIEWTNLVLTHVFSDLAGQPAGLSYEERDVICRVDNATETSFRVKGQVMCCGQECRFDFPYLPIFGPRSPSEQQPHQRVTLGVSTIYGPFNDHVIHITEVVLEREHPFAPWKVASLSYSSPVQCAYWTRQFERAFR